MIKAFVNRLTRSLRLRMRRHRIAGIIKDAFEGEKDLAFPIEQAKSNVPPIVVVMAISKALVNNRAIPHTCVAAWHFYQAWR